MPDGVAGEQAGAPPSAAQEAPADERVIRLQRGGGAAARGLLWLSLLAGVYALQRAQVRWVFPDGRLRMAAQLALATAGLGGGLLLGAREGPRWSGWPPQGTLLQRRTVPSAFALAQVWWQLLWLAPLAAVSAVAAASMAVFGIFRPQDVAAPVHAASLLWMAVVAAAVGSVVGRTLLRPAADAITGRGVHTSPLSFTAWGELSHALLDLEDGVVRLYLRRRPWMPRSVLVFCPGEEMEQAVALIAAHLPCLSREEEPTAARVAWGIFLVAAATVAAGVSGAMLVLLVTPGAVLVLLAGGRVPDFVVRLLEQMPEASLAIALVLGTLLDYGMDRLRGVRWKRIVMEEA